ncbi:hypothetical protein GCM10009560_23600 [Nonomuraea longicatena]|uniref:DUF2567 domain-containing protein n=1 Tax=Nonomuraea longicatena TaxID=83682 RepID=A0ABN1P6N0_9ACTN
MRPVRAFTLTVLILAALGVLAGLLWSHLSPRAPYTVAGTETVLADPSTQALIAADGWFAVVTGGLGLASGLAVWLLNRREGQLEALLGLCVGGALAAFLAYWAGSTFTLGVVTVEAAAQPGLKVVPGSLDLTARGVLVSWPLAAVFVFGLLEGLHGYRESPLRNPMGL